jgi:hypothetical protein
MGQPRRLGRRADAKPLVSCSVKLGVAFVSCAIRYNEDKSSAFNRQRRTAIVSAGNGIQRHVICR